MSPSGGEMDNPQPKPKGALGAYGSGPQIKWRWVVRWQQCSAPLKI